MISPCYFGPPVLGDPVFLHNDVIIFFFLMTTPTFLFPFYITIFLENDKFYFKQSNLILT
jgi:hypothetical protein